MFRLKNSGLPKDPVFPHDLTKLGLFINSDDEIRNIKRPDEYFDFFLTKNDRYNIVHREAMNSVIRNIIKDRLHALDLETVRLPLGVVADEPHVPIFISKNICKRSRVIVLFYEHNQDLGVFAHRVIGGRGGINEGSAVNFVKHIQSMPSSDSDKQSPGIILANMGQLRWWRRGKQAVSQATWYSLPQKSAVHGPFRFDMVKNTIPENRDTAEHVVYVMNHVVETFVAGAAKLDIIGVSDGAVELINFFNNERNFKKWVTRLDAVALLAPFHQKDHITNADFRMWLERRGRAYTTSQEQAGIAIATPNGTRRIPGFGCNTYSLGEPYYSELLLTKGYKIVIDFFLEVASDPSFENPKIFIVEPDDVEDNYTWDNVIADTESAVADVAEKLDDVSVVEKLDARVVTEMMKATSIAEDVDFRGEA